MDAHFCTLSNNIGSPARDPEPLGGYGVSSNGTSDISPDFNSGQLPRWLIQNRRGGWRRIAQNFTPSWVCKSIQQEQISHASSSLFLWAPASSQCSFTSSAQFTPAITSLVISALPSSRSMFSSSPLSSPSRCSDTPFTQRRGP